MPNWSCTGPDDGQNMWYSAVIVVQGGSWPCARIVNEEHVCDVKHVLEECGLTQGVWFTTDSTECFVTDSQELWELCKNVMGGLQDVATKMAGWRPWLKW